MAGGQGHQGGGVRARQARLGEVWITGSAVMCGPAVVDTFLALPQAQQLGLARNRHTGVRRDGLQVRQPVADKHDARVRPQAASGSRLAN